LKEPNNSKLKRLLHNYNKENEMSQTTTESTAITLSNEQRQACEVWTRVMGYHRPVSAFNKGKKSEHKERLHFKEQSQAA
jgi:anaerobic ribonucleoside-triphosphate reductase